MLVQEGLAEVMTSSLSEQVAYLLADRAALMEKIQALKNESKMLNAKSAQKKKTLDENVEKVNLLRIFFYYYYFDFTECFGPENIYFPQGGAIEKSKPLEEVAWFQESCTGQAGI